jgi:hypothetical protein
LVDKRQAERIVTLKCIESDTNATLEKLREEYKTVRKFQSSFSYIAIITIAVMIFTIVSIDLCRMISYFKKHRINKVSHKSEKIERSGDRNRNYNKSFMKNIDKRVLNFELKKCPI